MLPGRLAPPDLLAERLAKPPRHPPNCNATFMHASRSSSATLGFTTVRATIIPPMHIAAVACATRRRDPPFWL
jgi:hypothetical protein